MGFLRIGGLINGGFYRVTISNITTYGGFGGCSIYFLMNGRFLVDDTFFLYISYHPCSTTRFLYYHCKALKQYSAQLLIINCEGFTGGIQGYAAWKPTHPNISSENWWLEVGRGNFLLKYSLFRGHVFFFWDKHSNHRHVESIDCTMLHEQIFAGKGWLYLCPKAFTYQWPFKHSLRSIRNLIYDHFMYVKMSWRFFNATCLSRLSQHPKLPKQSTKE